MKLATSYCQDSEYFLNGSPNQRLSSSHQSTTHVSALQLKISYLGVTANWTRNVAKSSLDAFIFIISLAPIECLSQKDFTLGRDGLLIATWPAGATPMGPLASSPPGLLATGRTHLFLSHSFLFVSFFFFQVFVHECVYVHL